MRCTSRLFVVLIFASSFCISAKAQEPIRFARTPDISPDGKLVAFSYLGDIWTVETIGGVARPVTMHEAHDINPCFSPDGRWIAFSSNRHGSYDVFVVASPGGRPRLLTLDSAQDMALGWSPDGKSVIFSSTRGTGFPLAPAVYSIATEGGQEKLLPFAEAKEIAFSPSGNLAAFTRGPGLWYRKGYRGSSNDDLWMANADGTDVRRLTHFDGQDSAPMWSPDGRKVYYVSEQFGGAANIACLELNSAGQLEGKPIAVTEHRDDAVRRARISGN